MAYNPQLSTRTPEMSEHSRPYGIHSDEGCERRKRVETLPFTGRRRLPQSVDAPAHERARKQFEMLSDQTSSQHSGRSRKCRMEP